MLNLGVIGAGRIGQLHSANIVRSIPDARVTALADIAVDHARAFASKHGIHNVYDTPGPILEDPSIDAVLICTSTDTHARLIEEAAAAGKHVFCEKPIAVDLASIDRALDAVHQSGIHLQIGFNRRFDPSFAEVRRLIAENAVGVVHIVRISSRDPEPPPISYVATSGGLFVDMMIHDFDMARFVVGDEVDEVYAAGSVLVDPEIGRAGDIDTAVVTLKFRNGAIAAIDNSRRAIYGYDQRLEVFGSGGKVVADNPKPHTAVHSGKDGDHGTPLYHFFLERYADSFVREMKAFVEAIHADRTPPVTGADGRAPVVMALAAARSLAERRPVRCDEIR